MVLFFWDTQFKATGYICMCEDLDSISDNFSRDWIHKSVFLMKYTVQYLSSCIEVKKKDKINNKLVYETK